MATLQDVAQKAGVSTATVSKVLSNTPYVSERTRAKVMSAVRELKYTPNLAARALSSGKTHILAVVFPYVYDAIFKDPLVMQILEGIESKSSQLGYNILLSTPRLNETGPDEQYHTLIQSGYIDGLIAIDNVPLASVVSLAAERGIPSVTIGYLENEFYVRSDDFDGGVQQMLHVLELGHRHIGVISVPHNMNLALDQRIVGMQHVAEQNGIDFQQVPVASGDFSNQSGALCAEILMSKHPELTALICLNDRMALGAIQRLQALGLQVPRDVTVIGYDNIALSEVSTPSLTTINQQAMQSGMMAAQMLFAIFSGEKPSPVVLPTKLVMRQTSAVPRSHSVDTARFQAVDASHQHEL